MEKGQTLWAAWVPKNFGDTTGSCPLGWGVADP